MITFIIFVIFLIFEIDFTVRETFSTIRELKTILFSLEIVLDYYEIKNEISNSE